MLDNIKRQFNLLTSGPSKEDKKLIDDAVAELYKVYPTGKDPWGLNLDKARKNLEFVWPFYRHYFKVRIKGQENVQNKPYIVVSNHTGQIAIDGMLICTAFATEVSPQRILRPMVERFFNSIPFIGSWAAEGGGVLGDRQNCLNLLERGQSVLVFPEGVKGIAKSTPEFYQLQDFTRGFFRMALTANVDILPIAVIGAEEFYPYVYQAKGLAKTLGLPALPLTPSLIPLPSPVDISIGEAFTLPQISPNATNEELDKHISQIKEKIHELTQEGLKSRREFWANVDPEENNDKS